MLSCTANNTHYSYILAHPAVGFVRQVTSIHVNKHVHARTHTHTRTHTHMHTHIHIHTLYLPALACPVASTVRVKLFNVSVKLISDIRRVTLAELLYSDEQTLPV